MAVMLEKKRLVRGERCNLLLIYTLIVTVASQLGIFIYLNFCSGSIRVPGSSKLQYNIINDSTHGVHFPIKRRPYHTNRFVTQRGNYTVFNNFIQGSSAVEANKTVTLATHGSIDYLDNVLALVQFWTGPVSVAMYVPGNEFFVALEQISLYRSGCTKFGTAVTNQITWHIFFDHLPSSHINLEGLSTLSLPRVNCDRLHKNSHIQNILRNGTKLLFPINVARNIARENAETQLVLVNDIELYPNPPDLIRQFLKLLRKQKGIGEREVFVLPVFEVTTNVTIERIPRHKSTLQTFLKGQRPMAFPFHFFACFLCHRIPNLWKWMFQRKLKTGLNIFHSSPYITTRAWEPFFIGSKFDPIFDERLFRENALNKAVQVSILCHCNYTFHILDNAFLIHKPGYKYGITFPTPELKISALQLADEKILPLQYAIFGRVKPGHCWQTAEPNSKNLA